MDEGTCSAPEGCDQPVRARDLCGKHLQRWYRWGTTELPPRPETRTCRECKRALARVHFRTAIPVCEECYPAYMLAKHGPCKAPEGCDRIIKARDLCGMHYARWLRWGTTDERERPKELECLRCHQSFPREQFPSAKDRHCAECLPLVKQERSAVRMSRSNSAARIVAEMREAQERRCAICGVHENEAPRKRLAVDHHHETGLIRGLLCGNCNCGIGQFKDNPDLLRAAIRYLEETKPGQLALFAA